MKTLACWCTARGQQDARALTVQEKCSATSLVLSFDIVSSEPAFTVTSGSLTPPAAKPITVTTKLSPRGADTCRAREATSPVAALVGGRSTAESRPPYRMRARSVRRQIHEQPKAVWQGLGGPGTGPGLPEPGLLAAAPKWSVESQQKVRKEKTTRQKRPKQKRVRPEKTTREPCCHGPA